jgi:hypothetical protein
VYNTKNQRTSKRTRKAGGELRTTRTEAPDEDGPRVREPHLRQQQPAGDHGFSGSGVTDLNYDASDNRTLLKQAVKSVEYDAANRLDVEDIPRRVFVPLSVDYDYDTGRLQYVTALMNRERACGSVQLRQRESDHANSW